MQRLNPQRHHGRASLPGLLAGVLSLPLAAADQPQWGQAWSRNLVSTEAPLPASFDPVSGRNVRWSVPLGTETHSTPVIAGGRVYIGSNNGNPRDPRHQGDRGVLFCFNEKDGALQWQLIVPKREEDIYHDWPKSGISSPATVEGNRVYVVSNRGEVMCLDTDGLANGNDGPFLDESRHMTPTNAAPIATGPLDADILWLFDLTGGAGIWSHDAAHSSILIHGDHLYLNSGTGVDNTHKRIRTPDAPTLVVFDKRTGRYLARDQERIAPNIFHCTWSSPSLATVNGRTLIFQAGGNGIVYAFEPLATNPPVGEVATLKKVWQFDFDPKAPKSDVHRFSSNRRESPSNIYGFPVFHDGRLYVAGGGDWFWGKNEAWVKCIDPAGEGDITATALRWSQPVGRHTMCSPAVHDGLVYATDSMRTVHCLDAATGKTQWTHEVNGELWGSAYVADGKVYVVTRRGEATIFTAGREKQVRAVIQLDSGASATPIAANRTIYFATMTRLYAVGEP